MADNQDDEYWWDVPSGSQTGLVDDTASTDSFPYQPPRYLRQKDLGLTDSTGSLPGLVDVPPIPRLRVQREPLTTSGDFWDYEFPPTPVHSFPVRQIVLPAADGDSSDVESVTTAAPFDTDSHIRDFRRSVTSKPWFIVVLLLVILLSIIALAIGIYFVIHGSPQSKLPTDFL